jgi:hypothetical protein
VAWPWPRRRGSLVASAARGSVQTTGASLRGQSWQDQAFYFYDALGEIHEAAQFAARPLSKLELVVEELDAETGEWAASENPQALEAIGRLKGSGGDRSELLNAYGQLMFLAGECYLVGSLEDDEECWEFLSTAELKPIQGQTDTYQRIKYPGAAPIQLQEATDDDYEPLPDEVVVYRFWRRHPRYSLLADSPMRGVLEICAELEVLTRAVRGEALSRLAKAGVLFLPEELSFPSLEAGPDEDPDEDPLIRDLTDAARTAISDPGDASVMIPIVVRTRGENIAQVKHVTFGNSGNNYPEAKLRDEAINRLGIGLDMPVEALTGSGSVNHWGAWLIDDQAWRVHVQPVANLLVQNLTGMVFRTMLEMDGVPNPEAFRIGYDASSIVVNADRGRDAKDLHDRGAISDLALRVAAGFDDEDAPSVQDPNSNPRVILSLARAADFGGPATETGVPTGATPTPTESGPADVSPLPPNDGQSPTIAASGEPSLEQRIEVAAQLAVDQCRVRAGSRICSKAAKDPQVKAQVKDVSKRLVACAVGAEATYGLTGESPAELVAGGAETFHSALVAWGLSLSEADAMTAAVEAHAAETLFDADAARVPPLLCEGAAA